MPRPSLGMSCFRSLMCLRQRQQHVSFAVHAHAVDEGEVPEARTCQESANNQKAAVEKAEEDTAAEADAVNRKAEEDDAAARI